MPRPCAWEFSPRSGSPLSTTRLALAAPTWPSPPSAHSSSARSFSSWSTTSTPESHLLGSSEVGLLIGDYGIFLYGFVTLTNRAEEPESGGAACFWPLPCSRTRRVFDEKAKTVVVMYCSNLPVLYFMQFYISCLWGKIFRQTY